MANPTIRIFFVNLAVINNSSSHRLPISCLEEHSHIHGGLRIQIQDRLLPYMGYFGMDDVCFTTWLVELKNVYKTFETEPYASYIFDEGEQGQPAYLFEREGDQVFLSIIDSQYSNEGADEKWQRVVFDYQDFRSQYLNVKDAFIAELQAAAPKEYAKWVAWSLI